jgi:PDZ domain-containing protein
MVATPMQPPTPMTTSRNPVTAPPSVPEVHQGLTDGQRHTRRLWTAVVVAGGVFAGSMGFAATVEIDHYSFAPGSAIETEPLVTVEEGAETFEDPGNILFLTARVGPLRALEAVGAWADGEIDVIPAAGVLGGLSPEENRRRQAEAMVGSKNTALIVAFERLGIPLDPTGTGATVMETPLEDSPAAAVLRAADTITAVDDTPIELSSDLGDAIGSLAPGTEVTLTVEDFPDGVEREETVTLAERPDDPSRGFLGVVTDTRAFDPRPAFDVDIDSGRVGGPSAGLAFTLAIIDVLTEGSLTGGLDVAVTGVILEDGSVQPVGGVPQKTAAARDAGADVMIVPPGEAAQVRGEGDMEVFEVETLDEALEVLESLGGDPIPDAPAPAA